MRKLMILAAVAVAMISFCCCTGKDKEDRTEYYKNFNIMFERATTATDLPEARRDIAKAAERGELNEGQRTYLDAVVVYREFVRFDSVLTLCQPLVDMPEVKNDKLLLFRIYALMTSASEAYADFAEMVQYASQTERLARELGKYDKEQEMRGIMGYGMVLLGKTEDGLEMIDKALKSLDRRPEWSYRNSYIIVSKLKAAAFDETGRQADFLPVCQDVVNRLDDMTRHPEKVTRLPSEWEKDRSKFVQSIQLYRSQMYAYMAYAYAKTGRRDDALRTLALFDSLKVPTTNDSYSILVVALGELGMYDRMLDTYKFIDERQGKDTIKQAYGEELRFKAKAASQRGDYTKAHTYLGRALALEDTLQKRRDRDQMAKTLTTYKVHDEQMKASSAASRAKMATVVAVALLIIAVVSISLAVKIYRQNRNVKDKNKSLVDMMDRLYKYKDKYRILVEQTGKKYDETDEIDRGISEIEQKLNNDADENSPENNADRQLFAEMDAMIKKNKMYLSQDFQRQTIVDELGIDRNKIGKLIHDYSGFPNLSAYINAFRLEYAYFLLLNGDSKMTIDSVAQQSGFTTIRTFQRLFKEKYGMTPVEFREAK